MLLDVLCHHRRKIFVYIFIKAKKSFIRIIFLRKCVASSCLEIFVYSLICHCLEIQIICTAAVLITFWKIKVLDIFAVFLFRIINRASLDRVILLLFSGVISGVRCVFLILALHLYIVGSGVFACRISEIDFLPLICIVAWWKKVFFLIIGIWNRYVLSGKVTHWADSCWSRSIYLTICI